MKRYSYILTYGFATFAMFFGSGNLVFPFQIGYAAGPSWGWGILGLWLTGIVLPFLGLFVIKLHQGSYLQFFGQAGRWAKLMIPLFTLSLLGSWGVIPRCITVAYGGLRPLTPQLSLAAFSLVFCCVTYGLCLKDHILVGLMGRWMTPLLLAALLVLMGLGVYARPLVFQASTHAAPWAALSYGFVTGYQTMDLFAAFFFSSLLFNQLKSIMPSRLSARQLILRALWPSVLGAGLLGLVYAGLIYLGSHYPQAMAGSLPECFLPNIACAVLGPKGMGLMAWTMLLSCLTTAVALNNIYARYLCGLLQTRHFPAVLGVTTGISCGMSLVDFGGIAAFLGPLLQVSYPGLIVLTLLSLGLRGRHRLKAWAFWGVTLLSLGLYAWGSICLG
jgi:LIVCS family branched-chain amino acid:cation transporter